MYIINLKIFLYRESVFKGDNVFAKNLHMSFSAMTRLAKGLRRSALLTLKVENSLICLVGTRIPSVSMME
jgi:hypothetical protein